MISVVQVKIYQRGSSEQSNMGENIIAAAIRVALAVWLLQVTAASAQNSVCQNLAPSPTLTMFVDPLPVPPSITLTNATLTIGAYKITQVRTAQNHKD
jgi:hypothetical protein